MNYTISVLLGQHSFIRCTKMSAAAALHSHSSRLQVLWSYGKVLWTEMLHPVASVSVPNGIPLKWSQSLQTGWVLPECVERADDEEETCWLGWDAKACSNTWGVMEDTSIYECINVHTVSHTLYVSFIILRNIGMNYVILYIKYFNWFENICWILIYGCVT